MQASGSIRSLNEARAYLEFVSDFVGVPIRLVGVGPGRDQIVWTGDAVGAEAS